MIQGSSVSPDAGSEIRFQAYVTEVSEVIGHADRVGPLRGYCTGLLLPGGRKSIEPMAARLDPRHVQATHQSLHHLVAKAPWDDQAVLDVVCRRAVPALQQSGSIQGWILDDTGVAKSGRHSVGVARQYCPPLGKKENCQVAVSLSLANEHASLPVAFQLYLPEEWAGDPERRRKAGVPTEIRFRTKPEIALEQLARAVAADLPRGLVLADPAYGNDTALRDGITALGLLYGVGIQASTTVWPPGLEPLPPKPPSGKGRPAKRLRREAGHEPVSAKQMAQSLPAAAYRTVSWREGSRGALQSRFAAVRVRPAHRDTTLEVPRAVEWLLIEWPPGEDAPTKYWLSTLPEDTALEDLVSLVKLRWRIERDYRELKQEIGLDHFEGRGWRGFHHHASLCITAYAFLVAERCLFPPEHRFQAKLPGPLPGWTPRGAGAAARAP
jgi:SRSO17 transposase